jgi:hypothetical protein
VQKFIFAFFLSRKMVEQTFLPVHHGQTKMSDLPKKIFVAETFRFPYFWIKKMEGFPPFGRNRL